MRYGHGIRSGINLLVPKSKLDAVARVVAAIHRADITNDRIVYLPMRTTVFSSSNDGYLSTVSGFCLLGCSAFSDGGRILTLVKNDEPTAIAAQTREVFV